MNKKVLLRERKRHTSRRAASARFADGGGGTPSSPGQGDTPSSLGQWGVPRNMILDEGTTHQQNGVSPPIQTWDGIPPSISRMGYSPPPHPDLGRGTPSPPLRKCGHTKNITFPHPSDVGGNNELAMSADHTSRKLQGNTPQAS